MQVIVQFQSVLSEISLSVPAIGLQWMGNPIALDAVRGYPNRLPQTGSRDLKLQAMQSR
jgi:hypothetical protein